MQTRAFLDLQAHILSAILLKKGEIAFLVHVNHFVPLSLSIEGVIMRLSEGTPFLTVAPVNTVFATILASKAPCFTPFANVILMTRHETSFSTTRDPFLKLPHNTGTV